MCLCVGGLNGDVLHAKKNFSGLLNKKSDIIKKYEPTPSCVFQFIRIIILLGSYFLCLIIVLVLLLVCLRFVLTDI